MKQLIITENIVNNHFLYAEKQWEEESHIDLSINIVTENLYSIVLILINRLPNKFASLILAELVEREDFPSTLLSEVFDKGDKACRVAICLRDNLPSEIIEKCEIADDIDVYKHYSQKKDISR